MADEPENNEAQRNEWPNGHRRSRTIVLPFLLIGVAFVVVVIDLIAKVIWG